MRFPFSGLKEKCSGLIGVERSLGGREPGGGALTVTVKCQHLSWASAQEPQMCLLSEKFVRKLDWALEKILCEPCL